MHGFIRDLYDFLGRVRIGKLTIFAPDIQPITSRRDIVEGDNAVLVRNSIIRGAQGENDRTHLWMNIAEDVGDSLAVKPHGPARSRFIEAQVKTFAVE